MTIEYICINKYSTKDNEYFSLRQDAISYAEENDEITAIVKATYEPVYEEETIWEREEDELNGTVRDKISVCGFDKEDALRQRWGE
jgi:hypothetical protein